MRKIIGSLLLVCSIFVSTQAGDMQTGAAPTPTPPITVPITSTESIDDTQTLYGEKSNEFTEMVVAFALQLMESVLSL